MIKCPNSSRHCGTCKHWSGPRKITPTGIELDSKDVGKCGKKGNSNYGKEKVALTECSSWEKL